MSKKTRKQLVEKVHRWSVSLPAICMMLAVDVACNAHGPGDEDEPPYEDDDTDEVNGADPLPGGVYEIEGTDLDIAYDDLEPLGTMVSDARVVAMGESIHTSGGYHQIKHRLFRYLVEEQGFRTLALETSWTAADDVANYVLTCDGNAHDAVTGGVFGVWASQDLLDLVEWMCLFNQDHPDDKVSFFGFDIQQPWDDGPRLMEFIDIVAPSEAEEINTGLCRCEGATSTSAEDYYTNADGSVDLTDFQECIQALNTAEDYFNEHEEAIHSQTSDVDLRWARIHLVGLRAWEEQRYWSNFDFAKSYESRDVGMAYVFQEIWELRHPDHSVVIWAHNAHVLKNANLGSSVFGWSTCMGSELAAGLGDEYLPIALTGYEVWVNWPGVYQGMLPLPDDDDIVEVMLHELDKDYLFVDLDFSGSNDPFLESGEEYRIRLDSDHVADLVVSNHFRALVFLDESPGMDLL